MSKTDKQTSSLQGQQVLRKIFNSDDSSITTAGFLVGRVGRRIERTVSTTNVADDTETYDYIEDNLSLYKIQVIYTDGNKTDFLSAERTE